MKIEIKEVISIQDYDIGIKLFKEYATQIGVDLAFQNFNEELDNIKGQYSRPGGVLFIAYDANGTPLGCFGIRKLDSEICELKRMYLKKEARGRGLGKRLLEKSLQVGKELGYEKMRLDTLPTMQSAIGLYGKMGFYEIGPYRFNPVEGTKYMEINLTQYRNMMEKALKPEHIAEMSNYSFFTTSDGYRLAYRLGGEAGKPVLMLANSIGTDLHMWDGQLEELSRHFQVLRYDFRGHGASGAPKGPYSLTRMGQDVIELLDTLKIDRIHFCGLSLGGLVGQWLGVHESGRIHRLVLANTSAYLGPPEQWDGMIESVLQAKDMSELAKAFLNNWFPPGMLREDNDTISKFRKMLLATKPQGFAGTFAAIGDADMREAIKQIALPTMVIIGEHDVVTQPGHGELIADAIPGAKLISFPAVHLSNVQYPDDFTKTVLSFLLEEDNIEFN